MATVYQTCGAEVTDLAASVLAECHPDLAEAGVKVYYQYAYKTDRAGQPAGAPLKRHGVEVAATTKVNSHADRVAGLHDATVRIDGDQWQQFSPEKQAALLDHQLEYLLLCRDEQGAIELDDSCRPRLKIKPTDLNTAGFEAVLRRRKQASVEAAQLTDVWAREVVQGVLSWG